jgi:3' terminal RNA ribose 2'-O-methyltransferase Hen1
VLLTISTDRAPATDLGYLLHKNPARVQSFELSFGKAHVFYPHADEQRCTAALLMEVDPVGLVRTGATARFALEHYVNDRPYVASSFLSVAIAQVFGSALGGRCRDRPELETAALPLVARLSVVYCGAGEKLLRELFEPLGYTMTVVQHPLDEQFPQWGESRFYTLELQCVRPLSELLTHLYVLAPVLDDDKHYWVGEDEVEKLLRRGQGWLAEHPAKEQIARRYLKHQGKLTRTALARLAEEDEGDADGAAVEHAAQEAEIEERISLNDQRITAVLAALRASGANRVLDVGCGEGRLLRELLRERRYREVVGMDVSLRSLEIASQRLERMPPGLSAAVKLLHGSLVYRDSRLAGFDAAAAVEVVEHFDPPRLSSFEKSLFGAARPTTIVITTPNVEYNVLFPSLPAGRLRHRDHRFEWSRAEFRSWADRICDRYGYTAAFQHIGPEDLAVGSPTQMGVFTRCN